MRNSIGKLAVKAMLSVGAVFFVVAGVDLASLAVTSKAEAQANLELTVASLDAAWEKRHEQHPALVNFLKAKPKLPDDYEVLQRVARLVYYVGFFALPEDTSKDAKMDLFKYGFDAADKARKLEPKKVEGHYWYAVNLGGWGLAKGVMASLNSAESMRQALDEAIKIDPKFHFAGPLRVRGRLYFKLPGGFISFGDNKKALADLKKASELAPESKLNYIYLSEVQAKVDGEQIALKTLEKAKTIPDVVGTSEEASYKRDIAELEKKLR